MAAQAGPARSYARRSGVVCIDTTVAATSTDPFCGFTALTAPGGSPLYDNISFLSDPALVGTSWYAFNYVNGSGVTGGRNELLCFDIATLGPCAAQPYAVGIGSGTVTDTSFPPPSVAAIGGDVIVPVTVGSTDELACFDGSVSLPCTGAWPVPLGFNYDSTYGAPFPLLSSTAAVSGFCLPSPGDPCFDFTGASVATPAGMANAVTPNLGWNGPAFVLGPRVYVPNARSNSVTCYDASTHASCVNFPKSLPNLGLLYTVNADPARPTCIWVNSDNGSSQIQNFDAYTGGPCGEGAIRVLASSFVVDSSVCVPTSYSALQVQEPAPTSYSSGTVAFEDADANPIAGAPTEPLGATGTADLAGLDLSTTFGLPEFLITLLGTQGTPTSVVVRLTWTGADNPACVPRSQSQAESGPTASSEAGGGNAATNLRQCEAGDAVDCASGDLNQTYSDFSIPGRGLGLSLSRTYNSLDAALPSMFGFGWTCSLCDSLSVSPGEVTVTEGNGATLVFDAAPGGGYKAPAWEYATLSHSLAGVFTVTLRGSTRLVFSSTGRLTSVVAGDGTATTMSYDAAGRLTAATDAAGRSLRFVYGSRGHVVAVSDPAGRVAHYFYGPRNNLVEAVEAGGATTRFAYDSAHRIVVLTNDSGGTTTVAYGLSGRVTSETDPLGNRSTWSYSGNTFSAAGGTTVLVGPTGTRTIEKYANGTLVTETTGAGTPEAATTTYGIDPTSLSVVSITSPLGQVTRFAYNSLGLVSRVTNPAGDTWSYTYNAFGEPTSQTDPSGRTTAIAYDSAGSPTSITSPPTDPGAAPSVTRVAYGAPALPSHPTAVTGPSGHTTRFRYDKAGDLISTTSPQGETTSATYDADGELLTVTAPRGNLAGAVRGSYRTSLSYNSAGEVTAISDPAGATTRAVYNPAGLVTSMYLDSGVHHLAEARAYRWEFRRAIPLQVVTLARSPS